MTKKLPAVYVIADHTAGKAYVGSSVQLPVRLKEHGRQLLSGTHHNWKLQQAFSHGHDLRILPFALHPGEDPVKVEQALLDKFYDDGVLYNLSRDAEAPFRGRSHSEESREKNRQSQLGRKHSPETLARLSEIAKERGVPRSTIEAGAASRRGKSLSSEHVEKVRAASKAAMTPEAREHLRQVNLGIPHSQEDIERMRQIKRERAGKPVEICGQTYSSIAEASEALGVQRDTVKVRLNSPSKRFEDWKRL